MLCYYANMVLGTTTWRQRNTDQLIRTRDAAKDMGLYNSTIIDYGPGGAVNFLMDWLPEGDGEDWNLLDKLQRGVVKFTESVLRKTHLFSLETSEPEEIAYLFQDLSVQRISVVDKEKKVIDAVKKLVNGNGLSFLIDYFIFDIQKHQFVEQGDIVIAYNIIKRTKDPIQSLDNIAKTTRIGGLLSTTAKTVPEGFKQRGKGLYERVA